MKKIVLIATMIIATLGITLNAQTDNTTVLRQNINRPIARLEVKGVSSVVLVYDTANYIDVTFNPTLGTPLDHEFVSITGMTITIDDTDGEAVYELHLKDSDLQSVRRDKNATIIYRSIYGNFEDEYNDTVHGSTISPKDYLTSTGNMALQQTIDDARQQLQSARQQLQNGHQRLQITSGNVITDTVIYLGEDDSIYSDEIIEVVEDASDRHGNIYGLYDRLQPALLWGFTNWGNRWYNGISGMDGDYGVLTQPTSLQLEVQYSAVMTSHFRLNIGLGFEYDTYHFRATLVYCSQQGSFYNAIGTDYADYDDFILHNDVYRGTGINDWSSRLVTHYISLPIGISFRNNNWHIALTAIPSLSLNTRHSGLRNEIDNRRIQSISTQDLSDLLMPYKMDLRVELRYRWFGVFAQAATHSLMKPSTTSSDIFPFKLGLMLKSSL